MNRMRSGSALLIVLGMVAFMLFSGLAFSVYMRYSRLPTSFLRRTTTTHQLARAAVAEAMEAIDKAIGDDPHPGVQRVKDVGQNYWYNRVFFGEKREADPEYDSDTIATLTLEGLAYLPPNMINDARYYSRCTPTAKWHSFWFDSGRYAYTAIDVSDYFDVNKICANKCRAACASRRISLAHIFEKNGQEPHSSAGKGAEDWDKMIEGYGVRKVDTTTGEITLEEPFVSLADFNIAWTKELTIGGEAVKCPFRRFIEEGTPYGDNLNASDPKCEYFKQLTFVTESWTPADSVGKTPDGGKETVDLAAEQPFKLEDLKQTEPSLDRTVMRYQSDLLKTNDKRANLYDHICKLNVAQLWDYLDPDNIPVSLAIPTLERTPMIVGIQPTLPNIKIEKGAKNDSDVSVSGKTRKRRREQVYNLSLATQNVALRVLAAYPFRPHGVEEEDDAFKLDGRIALFFTVEDMSLRPPDAAEALQLKKDNLTTGGFLNDSVISIPLASQSVNALEIVKNESQPVKAVSMTGKIEGVGDGTKFLTVAYEWTQAQTDTGAWVPENPTEKDIVENGTEFAFLPLNATGSAVKVPADFVANLKNGTGAQLKVNAAVWARVSQNDKTVDLVPACGADDEEFLGLSGCQVARQLGQDYPLLRYNVKAGGQNDAIDLSVSALDASPTYPLSIDNPRAVVSDPRYNHMPENWYTITGNGTISEQDWMTETAKMVGQDGRDSDVFMFTSDQGYLQSVYELAYLPRFGGLTKDTTGESQISGDYEKNRIRDINNNPYPSLSSSCSDVADYNVMWRTYRCFGSDRDPFEDIGLVSGATGQHVNPYSDSTNVLMAAFANTPLDWRCSSTNEYSAAKDVKNAVSFNERFAWNGYDSNSKDRGKICWEHLQAVAGHLKDGVRYHREWETAFKNLQWSSDKRHLLEGVELDTADSDVYGVDKKFLYGFWHDSFGAGQQLFLIFVRAEPMMMGGGVAGQAPPQLGARAVALVWRDPSDTLKSQSQQGTQNAGVHRTRILFYHQFD